MPHLTLLLAGLLFVAIGVMLYVTRRGAEVVGLGTRGARIAFIATLVMVSLPLLLRIAGVFPDGLVGRSVIVAGFVLGLSALIATGLMLPIDVASWIASRWARRARTAGSLLTAPSAAAALVDGPEAADLLAPSEPAAPEMPRRAFLRRSALGSALAVGAGTSGYGVAFGRHDYQLEEVPIPLRELAPAQDGYTIAQLSDLHIGPWVGERELAEGLELVARARPDMIVLTGDLLDHDVNYAETLGRFARRLVDLGVRDGVVAIPGNHDYYAGIEEVLATLRRAGVDVLRNDARRIGEARAHFALLGVDDVWARRLSPGHGADLDAALRDAPRDVPRVLLCHNPEYYPEVADRVDVQLSGHTHGGQINVVVHPADLVLSHGYIRGHYHRGASQIYVNRGFGTVGPPARVGAAPEVSRIVLTRA